MMAYANMAIIKKYAKLQKKHPAPNDYNISAAHIAYIHDTELLHHKNLIV